VSKYFNDYTLRPLGFAGGVTLFVLGWMTHAADQAKDTTGVVLCVGCALVGSAFVQLRMEL